MIENVNNLFNCEVSTRGQRVLLKQSIRGIVEYFSCETQP